MKRFAFLPLLLVAFSIAANDVPLSTPGSAVIGLPQSASGAGVEVIVWAEQTPQGTVLVAKRIAPGGSPLDAEGIVIATDGIRGANPGPPFDIAFDGESFVVAWRRWENTRMSVLVRSLSPAGTISDPAVLASWTTIDSLSATEGGDGRYAIAWSGSDEGPPRVYRAMVVPFIGGAARDAVEISSIEPGPVVAIAATSSRYVAAFMLPFGCRLPLCLPEGPLYARSISFDGTMTTEPQLLSTQSNDAVDAIVASDDSVYVRWFDEVLRVRHDGSLASRWSLAREGITSLSGSVLRVDHGIVRASYSLDGVLVRFSPLGIRNGEMQVAALSRERILVLVGPESSRQLVIRSVDDPPAADLALVATGELLPSAREYERLAVFRVEHRGGAPVNRIEFWGAGSSVAPSGTSWRSVTPVGMWKTYGTVLERTLREGESFEITLPISDWAIHADVWIAGDVLDAFPANNVDQVQTPPRTRRRAARR